MQSSTIVRAAAAGLAAAVIALGVPLGSGAQQGIGVSVDGQPVNLAPAPIERAGRVFVPLRGVFERLGASVVYANGQINATKGRRDISLTIGSTQASVNGQPQALDVAPFIVGASTYVPLRFIAQALGDHVNWDGGNQIVAIDTGGPVAEQAPPPEREAPPPSQMRSEIGIALEEPPDNAIVPTRRPRIEGRFQNGRANPDTLRVILDQLDVTAQTTRSPNGFVYSPPSDLLSQHHIVFVRGRDMNGQPFDFHWDFTTGMQGSDVNH
jgi:hypothetical protein